MFNQFRLILTGLILAGLLFMFSPSHVAHADDHSHSNLTASAITTSIITIPLESLMTQWESVEFEGTTQYQVDLAQAFPTLMAESHRASSGFAYEKEINLLESPYLNWSWRVNKPLLNLPEQEKHGDDYAARIYVIVRDGWFFWQTKALNYVWSSRSSPPASWPNAYAPENTIMLPLKTADAPINTWFSEKRNVYEDLKQWLGKDIQTISAIAIMTDTDDSQSTASASYRNIFFSKQ